MLISSTKKINLMRRYICYTADTIERAPYAIKDLVKQMPKELNFTHTKNMPVIPEVNSLSAEHKNVLLAHMLKFIQSAHYNNYFCDLEISLPFKIKLNPKVITSIIYLVKAGANPDTSLKFHAHTLRQEFGCYTALYPLRIALEFENNAFIQFLLDHGANIHGPNNYESLMSEDLEPIYFARKTQTAQMLFDYGLRLDSKMADYSQLIACAIYYNKPLELIKLYLSHGGPVTPDTLDALIYSTHPKLLQITELFINLAPHIINATDNDGYTFLDTAQVLLERYTQFGEEEKQIKIKEFIALLKKNGAKTSNELKNLE